MSHETHTCETLTVHGRYVASVVLFVLGCIVGTVGTLSSPASSNLGYFWPAASLQTVSGLLFGVPGVVAGVSFPLVTNGVTDGNVAHILGLVPANMVQCGLPMLLVRGFRLPMPCRTAREGAIFLVLCVVIPHTLGAILGCGTLWWLGELPDAAAVTKAVCIWMTGNIPAAALFAPLLCWSLSPVLRDIGWCSEETR